MIHKYYRKLRNHYSNWNLNSNTFGHFLNLYWQIVKVTKKKGNQKMDKQTTMILWMMKLLTLMSLTLMKEWMQRFFFLIYNFLIHYSIVLVSFQLWFKTKSNKNSSSPRISLPISSISHLVQCQDHQIIQMI